MSPTGFPRMRASNATDKSPFVVTIRTYVRPSCSIAVCEFPPILSDVSVKLMWSGGPVDGYKPSFRRTPSLRSPFMLTLVPDGRSEMNFSAVTTHEAGETSEEQRTIVTFTGELDFSVAAAVSYVLADVTAPATLDFSGVRFLDSSTLTELMKLARRIAPQQAVITGLQPQIRRIFEIVGFDRVFLIYGTRLSIVPAISKAPVESGPASPYMRYLNLVRGSRRTVRTPSNADIRS